MWQPFLSFKNGTTNENSSLMFYAAYLDMPNMLEFLVKLELRTQQYLGA